MKHNRQYVKVTEAFIGKGLTASAVKVMFLLASVAQAARNNTIVISNARIAERAEISSAANSTAQLCEVGAVEKFERYSNNKQCSNGYIVSEALCKPKNYAVVPVEALRLKGSCLRLLIVYCLFARPDGCCTLSLNELSMISGMTVKTIIACNIRLVEYGFIAKQCYKRREGDFGVNRVYITHLIRRCGTRVSETFRVLVNGGGTLVYESKCEAEDSLAGRMSKRIMRLMRYLYRSTRVAGFIRKARMLAHYFCNFGGTVNFSNRYNLIPVLNLQI